MTAIDVAGVHKSYGSVHAVTDVSFSVRAGEFFGLIGPNGAGKTTLIEMLEGLREPDAGQIRLLGQPPWPRNPELLSRIGLQTQSSAFFAKLTAVEHLETVAALYGVGAAQARETLDLVGLADAADRRVETLSGGQKQRLSIAAALTHQPELIFLDEPTAALDPHARRALWQVLLDVKARGCTIVYTTHHMDEAEALCDRVAIIRSGSLIALDTPVNLIRELRAPSRVLIPRHVLTPESALGIDGVDEVSTTVDSTVLVTRSVSRVLTAVGRVADLDGVQTRTATLEDVYLDLTGTEYRP